MSSQNSKQETQSLCITKLKKDKKHVLSFLEVLSFKEEVQDLTKKFEGHVSDLAKAKETEVMDD